MSESAGHSDAVMAVRNALKLGASLMTTWGIALGVRLLMPRFLGPDAWGPLNFADVFTSTFFVLTGLGVDVYIRKEVSVRTSHASEFFAGVTAVRAVMAVVLFTAMEVFMHVTDRPPEVRMLVRVFGLGNLFFMTNNSLSALLHAKGTVNELSVLNIASKLVWGGGVVLSLLLHWPLVGIAGSFAVAELLKVVVTLRLVQRYLHLTWHVHLHAARLAIVASLPMFLNSAAHNIYNKLDVSILAVVAGDKEVAWYGASSLLAGLTLMVVPMIGWVLTPLFARARARSDDEYVRVMRRAMEMVLIIAIPTSLFVALGADLWIALLYGPAYAPSAASLRILAPIFVLTYVAIISANSLIITNQAWSQALISIAGLVVNPLFNSFAIPWGMESMGAGGAGIGAALAQLATEVVVTSVMLWRVGRRAFDRRTVVMVVKTVVVCGLTIALDRLTAPYVPSMARVAIDAVAYVGLLVAVRAVAWRETLDFARSALARRRQKSQEVTVPVAVSSGEAEALARSSTP